MSRAYRRAILLALAVLHDAVEQCGAAPVKPNLKLRALLALLYHIAEGTRRPFDRFWSIVTSEEDDANGGRLRQEWARAEWVTIVRQIGWNAADRELHEAIAEILHPDSRRHARAILDGGLTREIIASKGHPRSEEARALMERNIAEHRQADGEPWQ